MLTFTVTSQNNMDVLAGIQREYGQHVTVTIATTVKRGFFGTRTTHTATMTPSDSVGVAITNNIRKQLTR